MGNDTRFYLAKNGDSIPSDEKECSTGRNRSTVVGLFWLACFRPDDFRPNFPDRLVDCDFPHFVCPAEKARNQFEAGLDSLKKYFTQTNFDLKIEGEKLSILEVFREELYDPSWGFVHMEISQIECDELFLLLNPALIGFDYPKSEFFFGPNTVRIWDDSYPAPNKTGCMTWAGVIRRLCIPSWNVPAPFADEYDNDPRSSSRPCLELDYDSVLVGGFGW